MTRMSYHRRRRYQWSHLLPFALLAIGSAAFAAFTSEGIAAVATGSGVVYPDGGLVWGLVAIGIGVFSLAWFLGMVLAVLLGRAVR